MFNRQRLPVDLAALVLLGLVVFVALSLASFDPADPPSESVYPLHSEAGNILGTSGAIVANNLRNLLGLGAWFLPVALGCCGLSWLLRQDNDRPIRHLAGWSLLVVVGCITLHGLAPSASNSPPIGSGGYIGAWLWSVIEAQFALTGIFILLATFTVSGAILALDQWSFRFVLAVVTAPYLLFHRLGFGAVDEVEQNAITQSDSPTSKVIASPVTPGPNLIQMATESASQTDTPQTARLAKPIRINATPQPSPFGRLPTRPNLDIHVPPIESPLSDAEVGTEFAPPTSNDVANSSDEKPASSAPEFSGAMEPLGKVVVPPIGVVPARSQVQDEVGFDDDVETSSNGDETPTDEDFAVGVATPPTAQGVRQPIKINPPAMLARASASSPPRAVRRPDYKLPTADILEPAEPFPFELMAEKAQAAAAILEKTFQEFGLNVRVVEIDTGPVITQFELELEAGLRLAKVTALADDLAIALRVPSVRVVAPIPGKNTVGVEVPNDTQVMVRLRELIEATPEAGDKRRIPIFLGKDVSGRPLVVDLAKMPHLLIAGRTGTGKSVCLNSLILSILMTRTPEQVKMLMIDPKMVELSPYKRIPHLMHPVITDMKKAEAVLGWAVDKMEERYDILARCGVRHLDSYNELGRDVILKKLGLDPESEEAEQLPDRMPYIVIIADEMADMMMTSGKEVEGFIIRLAQKSRAVGIHLVLATQKPTVDVITGLIKSNLPARIAFQVASRVDSRVVLDEMGADRLLGNGDMLYLIPGTSKITRAQGTYVSDNEVNAIIEFFSDCEPEYSRELASLSTRGKGDKSGIDAIRSRDEMYEQAIDVVVREGRGSVSLLQRALGIGYGRAARLIDYMAEDGIVGDYNGSQAREVMYTPEQWQEVVSGMKPTELAS